MIKRIFNNQISRFVIVFLLTYATLYFLNYAWTGITIPGGTYNVWVDEYLDYISGMRNLVLYSASYLLNLFGYDNYAHGYYLTVTGIKSIRMVYSCIGLNIICVWWAFVLAFPQCIKGKAIHLLSGTMIITGLNIIRIALVAISPRHGHFLNTPFNHHDVFNVVVYSIIIFMVVKNINRITAETK